MRFVGEIFRVGDRATLLSYSIEVVDVLSLTRSQKTKYVASSLSLICGSVRSVGEQTYLPL